MELLKSDSNDNGVFQLPWKRQWLESAVPEVQAKPATVVKQPPATPTWLTGALQEQKSGGCGGGWARGRGRGDGFLRNRGRDSGRDGGRGSRY